MLCMYMYDHDVCVYIYIYKCLGYVPGRYVVLFIKLELRTYGWLHRARQRRRH